MIDLNRISQQQMETEPYRSVTIAAAMHTTSFNERRNAMPRSPRLALPRLFFELLQRQL